MGILTVEELLNKQEEMKRNRHKIISIKELGELEIELMTIKEMTELTNKIKDSDRLIDEIVYRSLINPNLNDPVLIKNNNIKPGENYKLVQKLFGDFKYKVASAISEEFEKENKYLTDDEIKN